ncbi:hypothetical protein EV361DRAFT_884781, partial [Lentinula raphanica]
MTLEEVDFRLSHEHSYESSFVVILVSAFREDSSSVERPCTLDAIGFSPSLASVPILDVTNHTYSPAATLHFLESESATGSLHANPGLNTTGQPDQASSPSVIDPWSLLDPSSLISSVVQPPLSSAVVLASAQLPTLSPFGVPHLSHVLDVDDACFQLGIARPRGGFSHQQKGQQTSLTEIYRNWKEAWLYLVHRTTGDVCVLSM